MREKAGTGMCARGSALNSVEEGEISKGDVKNAIGNFGA